MPIQPHPDRFGALLSILQALYDSKEKEVSVYTLLNLICASPARKYYWDISLVEAPELDDETVYSWWIQKDLDHLVETKILEETKVREDLGKGERELSGYKISQEGLEKGAKLFLSLRKSE